MIGHFLSLNVSSLKPPEGTADNGEYNTETGGSGDQADTS